MKESKAVKIFLWVSFAMFMLYILSLTIPLYYMILNSFKTNGDYVDNRWGLPSVFTLQSFAKAFTMRAGETTLPMMLLNSVLLSVGATVISVTSISVTAYTLARFRFTGRNLLVVVAISAMAFPSLGGGAATYKLMVNLGLVNTWGILLMFGGPFGFSFLIMYAYFKGVSKTYAEAARLDGAGEFLIFFRIILPMTKAALGVIIFMGIVGSWNDYYTPYMYLPEMKTLATGLQAFSITASTTGAYTQMFAAMIIGTAPMVILFVCMHKTIINNTVRGGLKG